MRERLIELIMSNSCHEKECPDVQCDECPHIAIFEGDAEKIADLLLADGWMRPPCKVGDTVYVPSGDEENDWIDEYKVKYFYCSSKGINRIYIECGTMGNNFRPKDIGKTFFLTREEAEAALKGGAE